MEKNRIKVQKLSVNDETLSIHIICYIEHDSNVFEPKLKMFLDNGSENIILPILNTKRDKDHFQNFELLEFKHSYFIDNLFMNKKWEKSKISFVLSYGEALIKNIELDSNMHYKENSSYSISFCYENKKLSIYLKKDLSNMDS